MLTFEWYAFPNSKAYTMLPVMSAVIFQEQRVVFTDKVWWYGGSIHLGLLKCDHARLVASDEEFQLTNVGSKPTNIPL